MNKKTNIKTIPIIMLLIGFVLGIICGVIFTLFGVGYIVSQINVDNINIDFNETQFIDYTYEKIQKEHTGIYPLYKYNITEYNMTTNITIYNYNKSTGKFNICCYPVECGKLNPPKCECIYPVKCITKLENMGPFNHPPGYL